MYSGIQLMGWNDLPEDEKDIIRRIRGRGNWEYGKNGQRMEVRTKICPNCRRSAPYFLLQSLDLACNESNLCQIMSGRVFEHKCPHCHERWRVERKILIYNSKKKYAVQLVSDIKEILRINELFESSMTQTSIPEMKKEKYIFRIVPNIPSFLDRIQVFESGLDDRVVEMVKWGRMPFVQDRDGNNTYELCIVGQSKYGDDLWIIDRYGSVQDMHGNLLYQF